MCLEDRSTPQFCGLLWGGLVVGGRTSVGQAARSVRFGGPSQLLPAAPDGHDFKNRLRFRKCEFTLKDEQVRIGLRNLNGACRPRDMREKEFRKRLIGNES